MYRWMRISLSLSINQTSFDTAELDGWNPVIFMIIIDLDNFDVADKMKRRKQVKYCLEKVKFEL